MSTNGHLSTASIPSDALAAELASMSPSLRVHRALGPAYEIKFLLTEAQAREAEERLLPALLPDPHADPALGGMYAIRSLACDNPSFGVFFHDEAIRNRKYRVRCYGESMQVYLERKRSSKGRVRKHRVEAALKDLGDVVEGRGGDASHAWFVRALRARDLSPVCRLRYLRRALFGATREGPMRVTFDREVHGSLARGWSLEAGGEERRLLRDVVVCEFKFRNAMPGVLKGVVAAMNLEATGISKYRTCVRAFAPELGLTLAKDGAEKPERS